MYQKTRLLKAAPQPENKTRDLGDKAELGTGPKTKREMKEEGGRELNDN